jgi:alcohol dehydrogenase class IV
LLMWWFISPKIVFGNDALEHLGTVSGTRALIVTDAQIRSLGFVEEVAKCLAETGKQIHVFDEVEEEPSLENVALGAQVANDFHPDLIVALGGGSCIDAAKAIWIQYEHPELRLEEVSALTELGPRKKAGLVAIPTTSGGGSDASWIAVITNKAERIKLDYITSHQLVPDVSILDPRFCAKMPKALTAHTGLDALTQGIEAYVTTWRTDFSDALAIRAVQLAFRYLERSYNNPNDLEAREKMHNAGSMSGLACSNSQFGMAHSMGHAVGATYHMAHGLSVAISNLYVIPFSRNAVLGRYAEIANALGIGASTPEHAVEKLVESLAALMERLDQPTTFADFGIKREELTRDMKALIDKTNMSGATFVAPRIPSSEQLEKLYLCAFDGSRVDF